MHIGIVTSYISRNGGGLYDATRLLSQHLSDIEETKVSVFGLRDEHTMADLQGWTYQRPQYFTTKGPRVLGWAPGMAEALLAANLDIIHQHGLWTLVSNATQLWHRRTGNPYVVSPHGMLDAWALNNSALKKKLAAFFYESRNLNSAACLHALCKPEADSIREYGLTNKVSVIPNGVVIPDISTKPATKSIKTLLYLGRLHPKKGLEHLIQAWSRINPDGWQLNIVGSGTPAYERELRTMISVRRNISLQGPKYYEEKLIAFEQADASILPSFSEGLPLSILEAMSYGLPSLITDACNLPDAFEANAALRIEPEANSIEAGLRKLFSLSDEDQRNMGRRARQLIENTYTWPQVAAAFHQLYQSILRGD